MKVEVESAPLQVKEPEGRRVTLDDHEHFDIVLKRLETDLTFDFNNPQVHYNKGAWLLSAGRFAEGWPELAWRLLLPGVNVNYTLFPIPEWNGEDIAGKHVFVWLEQGIGDQIHCASMIPDLIERAGQVTIYCNRRLASLFKRSFPEATILKPGELTTFHQYHYQMAFSDVGELVRTSFESFPNRRRFLKPDSNKTAEMRARYKAIKPGNKVVGLSWRSTNAKIGEGKSIPFYMLDKILSAPNTTFISLQYDELEHEREETRLYHDPSFNQMTDMDSFASQVAAMDKVISISNTALHMAGALGIKTLALMSRGGCRNWYWFNERTDCPWYPSVEIVRQHQTLFWDAPLEKASKWVRFG